jgi:hypothetical protein
LRVQPCHDVHERHADLRRRLFGLPRDRHQSALALDDEVVTGPIAWLAFPEPRDRAVDDARVASVNGGGVEAEAGRRSRAEVLDHDVCTRAKVER